MEICIIDFMDREYTVDIAEHVKARLGVVESARATADNCAEALGRLLDILAEKKLLTAKDVMDVVEEGCSDYANAKFVDDEKLD